MGPGAIFSLNHDYGRKGTHFHLGPLGGGLKYFSLSPFHPENGGRFPNSYLGKIVETFTHFHFHPDPWGT